MIWKINQPFDLGLTLECSQGHRWLKEDGNQGWYSSVIHQDLVRIRQTVGVNGPVEFRTTANCSAMKAKLRWQFRLEDPIQAIYAKLRRCDAQMDYLVGRYPGLRVMRVDPWECLIFFTLASGVHLEVSDEHSPHNNMERIAELGQEVGLDGNVRRIFPTASRIAQVEIAELGVKHRFPKKIPKAILKVAEMNPDLKRLKSKSYQSTIDELRKLPQIGDKAANCIALFSLEKIGAFPRDTHINQYGGAALTPRPYAGYASQFLFIDHYLKNKPPK